MLSGKQKKAIKKLAVAYAAYCEAAISFQENAKNCNTVLVWGLALLEAQEYLGVELRPATSIKTIMETARRVEERLGQ